MPLHRRLSSRVTHRQGLHSSLACQLRILSGNLTGLGRTRQVYPASCRLQDLRLVLRIEEVRNLHLVARAEQRTHVDHTEMQPRTATRQVMLWTTKHVGFHLFCMCRSDGLMSPQSPFRPALRSAHARIFSRSAASFSLLRTLVFGPRLASTGALTSAWIPDGQRRNSEPRLELRRDDLSKGDL